MTAAITKDPRFVAILNRAKGILLSPKTEWDKIEGEPADIVGLFKSYALPLAAIPAICGFIGLVLFAPSSVSVAGMTIGMGFGAKIGHGVITYISYVLMVAVIAFASEFLAPHFGGKADRKQAFKLAAYSLTAAWLAGVAGILPGLLKIISLAGLYSFYLFFLGAPKLLKTPQDKTVPFTAVVTVITMIAMSLCTALMY